MFRILFLLSQLLWAEAGQSEPQDTLSLKPCFTVPGVPVNIPCLNGGVRDSTTAKPCKTNTFCSQMPTSTETFISMFGLIEAMSDEQLKK